MTRVEQPSVQEEPAERCLWDPELVSRLNTLVFPAIASGLGQSKTARIWVRARTGAYAHTVSVAAAAYLESVGQSAGIQVFATFSTSAEARAAAVLTIAAGELAGLPPDWLSRFFVPGPEGFTLCRRIRERMVFARHDLIVDPPLPHVDLVCMESAFDQVPEEEHNRALAMMGYALKDSGILVLGRSWPLGVFAPAFVEMDPAYGIYRRSLAVNRLTLLKWMKSRPSPAFEIAKPLPEIAPLLVPQISATLRFSNAGAGKRGKHRPTAAYVNKLERELVSTRCHVQAVIGRLKASEDEALTTNDELRSTIEELQAASEEADSANCELRAVNAELEYQNAKLARYSDDLRNVLESLDMPMILVDESQCIRHFNKAAHDLVPLAPGDVGRPIADLELRIRLDGLPRILDEVIGTGSPIDLDVQHGSGRWYVLRIRPYMVEARRIAGAVLRLVDVDDLKRRIEELKRAHAYVQAILDTVDQPLVVVDAALSIRDANPAFCRFLDLESESVKGRGLFEIGGGEIDIPAVRELAEQVRNGKEAREVEVSLRINGTVRYVLVSGRKVLDSGLGDLALIGLRDVTARKRAVEARYRGLFESARDGIVIVDAATGEVLDVNHAAERFSGYSRAELVGRLLWELEILKGIPEIRPAFDRLRREGIQSLFELELRTRQGSEIQIEIAANLFSELDRQFVQYRVRDVTEHRKFERNLLHTQKLESLGLLAGGIAHDFNNLLTGIMGNASLVAGSPALDPMMRVRVQEILRGSEQAAHLTRQMLAYAGKGRFVMERVDLGELVRNIEALIRTSVSKNVTLDFEVAPGTPPVEGDPGQLQQLVMNLVVNGAEAIGESQRGTVRLRAAVRNLLAQDVSEMLGSEDLRPDAYVVTEVTDTGAGMDEATKARIFDPFFTTKFTGRGLGLAAALGIVKSHHGGIRVSSAPGQGTTFQVVLPPAKGATRRAAKARVAAPAPADATVLLVDDEEIVRNVVSAVLERQGYRVSIAENGKTGVELFRAHAGEISLVILDLLMPEMGGEEALERMREIRPDVRVLLSSGFGEREARRRFGSGKFAGFIQKPYDVERLLDAISRALISQP